MQLGACQAGVKGAHKPTHASPPPNAPTRKQHMHTSAPDSCRLMTVCALWIVCVGGVHACLRRCTHSLTHVEIWLPYFTAPTAFVNANCFPASPTPSLRCDWTIPRRLWLLTNWRNNPPGMGGLTCGGALHHRSPPPAAKYQEDIVNRDRCFGKLHKTEVIFFPCARSFELPKLRQQLFVGFWRFYVVCTYARRGLCLLVAPIKALLSQKGDDRQRSEWSPPPPPRPPHRYPSTFIFLSLSLSFPRHTLSIPRIVTVNGYLGVNL